MPGEAPCSRLASCGEPPCWRSLVCCAVFAETAAKSPAHMQESGRSARRACVSLLMAKTSPSHPNKGSVAPMPPASDTGFEHLRSVPKGSSVEPETRRKSLSEPSKGAAAAARKSLSEPSKGATAAAKPEPSQAQSAIAARMAQPPTIAVRGGCSSPAPSSGGAGEGKVPAALAPRKGGQLYTPPKDLVFLYPPVTLPSLIVSSMLVPTVRRLNPDPNPNPNPNPHPHPHPHPNRTKVRRPLKGVPTFVLSCTVQAGLGVGVGVGLGLRVRVKG